MYDRFLNRFLIELQVESLQLVVAGSKVRPTSLQELALRDRDSEVIRQRIQGLSPDAWIETILANREAYGSEHFRSITEGDIREASAELPCPELW